MSAFTVEMRHALRMLYYTGEPPEPGTASRAATATTTAAAADTSAHAGAAPPAVTVERRRTRPARIEHKTLFGEILDWMFAPLMLLWPVSVAITFVAARSIADQPYDYVLRTEVRLIAQQTQFVDGRPVLPRSLRAPSRAIGEEPAVQLLTRSGAVLAGPADLPRPPLYDFPEAGRPKLRNDIWRGEEIRVAYQYLYPAPDATEPVALVQLAEGGARRETLTNEIIKSVILPQFLIIPLAGALVWFGLGRGLAPLRAAQQRIRARRPDDQSPIQMDGVPQEVLPLVESFNDLLGRLNLNISAQKRFIADAAHQIKTPLAGLRTQAELALRQTDPAEVRAALERVVLSTDRATRLVNQLLVLARTDASRAALSLEPLDLALTARRVCADWVDRARVRSIDLGYEAQGDDARSAAQAWIRGNLLLIEELINNLVDNALRYTPAGSIVTVRVGVDAAGAVLVVEDDGPGIPTAERGRVFDRFYRVLGSGVEGSGLGLAIVKEIAEQHRVLIELQDTHPGRQPPGLRVLLRFPTCAAPPAAGAAAASEAPF